MNGRNYEFPHCGAFSTPHFHLSWAQIPFNNTNLISVRLQKHTFLMIKLINLDVTLIPALNIDIIKLIIQYGAEVQIMPWPLQAFPPIIFSLCH